MKTVAIIGGSGFIGSYITKKFLEEGFLVKASVTNIKKSEKYQHLFTQENSDNLNISRLKAEDFEAVKEFIGDCEIVIHGGTPFQLEVEDPKKELFEPTVRGTENFLKAISQAPRLKKIIFIASVAAYNTNFPLPAGNKSAEDTFSEKDTPFTSPESHPYAQAKFLANQMVEEFISNNKKSKVEIVSVSPVMVLGKSLSHREDSTSTGIQFLFQKKIAPNPFIQMFYDEDVLLAIVDVRDVAEAVFHAATTAGLHGKNYLLSSESYPVSDVSLMLNHQSPKNESKQIYDNGLARQDLNIHFRPVRETLSDYSM
jgi:nucleoside-diphosphate-sugar epimerase